MQCCYIKLSPIHGVLPNELISYFNQPLDWDQFDSQMRHLNVLGSSVPYAVPQVESYPSYKPGLGSSSLYHPFPAPPGRRQNYIYRVWFIRLSQLYSLGTTIYLDSTHFRQNTIFINIYSTTIAHCFLYPTQPSHYRSRFFILPAVMSTC